jgi:hypothetical protein
MDFLGLVVELKGLRQQKTEGGMEIEELARDLRARQTAIETIVLAMFTHLATNTEAPAHFIGQIVDDADRIMLQAQQQARGEDVASTAAARNALHNFNHALLVNATKISPASARG